MGGGGGGGSLPGLPAPAMLSCLAGSDVYLQLPLLLAFCFQNCVSAREGGREKLEAHPKAGPDTERQMKTTSLSTQ